jgi:hypothetical protein
MGYWGSGLTRMDEDSEGLDATVHSRNCRTGRTIEDALIQRSFPGSTGRIMKWIA